MSVSLPLEPEQVESHHDERVADAPLGDERGDAFERDEPHARLLRPVVQGLVPVLHVAREERVDPVVLYRRVRPRAAERDELARLVTRLLKQLARRSLRRPLARVNHPARNLQRYLLRAVPVKLYEHDLALFRQRDDVDPVGRLDDVEVVDACAARVCAQIAPDLEDAAVRDLLRALAPPSEPRVVAAAQTSVTSTRGSISVLGMSAGQ